MDNYPSREEFKRFLDAVLSEDKVSEIIISFKYDNSLAQNKYDKSIQSLRKS